MREFLFVAGLVFYAGAACASVADYCILDVGTNTCYWCAPGGDSKGYCDRGYVGCPNRDQVIIASGNSFTGYHNGAGKTGTFRCSENGFCYTKCSGERWYDNGDGTELRQVPSGCLCNQWTSTGEMRCAAGYYGPAGGLNCQQCPEVFTYDGLPLPVTSRVGMNFVVDDCFIDEAVPGAMDASGEYDYTGICFYGDNNSSVVPVPTL